MTPEQFHAYYVVPFLRCHLAGLIKSIEAERLPRLLALSSQELASQAGETLFLTSPLDEPNLTQIEAHLKRHWLQLRHILWMAQQGGSSASQATDGYSPQWDFMNGLPLIECPQHFKELLLKLADEEAQNSTAQGHSADLDRPLFISFPSKRPPTKP